MKWVELALFIGAAAWLMQWLRADRRAVTFAAFAIGFLPFVTGPWHLMVAPYAIPMWPGYVKGWEISLLDAVAAAVLLGTPRARLPLPFRWAFLAFIAAATLSVFLAPNFKYALAYPIQLARAFLVFAAVARLSASPAGLKAVLQGLFVGMAFQAVTALVDWLGGAAQTGGSFGHQNLLGFVSHLVVIPAFGLLLSGLWRRWAMLGFASGVIAVILTASRATIAFAAFGLLTTYFVAAISNWTSRKAVVGVATLAFIAVSLPLANVAFERRNVARGGDQGFFAEDEEREAFSRAARAMIADHPFGVGANHYVVVANTEGYSERAGVAWRTESRGTNVHNSYLLVGAETGFLGLFTLIYLFAASIMTSLVQAFRNRADPSSDILVGIAGGLCAVVLHSLYEWMFVTFQGQYLFALSLGLAAGIIRRMKLTSMDKQNRRRKRKQIITSTIAKPGPTKISPSP